MAEDLTLREQTNPRDIISLGFVIMTGYAGVKRNNLCAVYRASFPTKVMQIIHLLVRNLGGILSEDGKS